MCYADAKKAFDSVSHDAILKALESAGAPANAVNYIRNLYTYSNTQISVNGSVSEPISVKRGVKQGDPLSCFLFNLVVDQCLRKLDTSLGVKLAGEVRVNHLAYADDVVLLAESPRNLNRLVQQYTLELSRVGLEVNAAKCATVNIRVHKRKAGTKWVVDSSSIVEIDGAAIPSLPASEAYRYLGVGMGSRPKDDRKRQAASCHALLEKQLNNISAALLKPQQRLKTLREHLLPKLTHQLVLVKPTKDLLMRLDVLVRRAVSKWLHLPHGSPVAYYHAPTAVGGLGIKSYMEHMWKLREKRLLKLLHYDAQVVDWLVRDSIWGRTNLNFLRCPAVPGGDGATTHAVVPCLSSAEKLHTAVDCKGLAHHALVKAAHGWLLSDSTRVKGAEFVHSCQLRAGLIPTPARKSRIYSTVSGFCEYCGGTTPATLSHILQKCVKSHGQRVFRHDYVVKYLAGRLRQLGLEVLLEPHIVYAQSFRKPDIVAWGADQSYIIDVAVTRDDEHPDSAHAAKVDWYDRGEITEWVKRVSGRNTCKVSGAVLNWRGAFSPASAALLKELGLSRHDLQIMSMRTLAGGWAIWRAWCNTTWL